MLALVHAGHDLPPILRSVQRPKAGPGQLLLKIAAAAIQPSDVLNAEGLFNPTADMKILGRDFAGIVVDGPPDLRDKHVFGSGGKALSFEADGTHAEYCIVPSTGVVVKPETISFVQAAMMGTSGRRKLLQRFSKC